MISQNNSLWFLSLTCCRRHSWCKTIEIKRTKHYEENSGKKVSEAMFFCEVLFLLHPATNDGVRKTDKFWQITCCISSYNPTSHKATAIKTLKRLAQLVCDTQNSLHDKNTCTLNMFSQEQLHLLLQWLYLKLRALLRPSHRSYSPTTST